MVSVLMIAMMAQGGAGQPPELGPEAVMRAFFDDLAEQRWRAAAERYHPEAVTALRARVLAEAAAREERVPVDIYPPDMPQEVRDYFQARRSAAELEPDVWSPPWTRRDTVEALTGLELLARMLEWSDPRSEVRRSMRAQGAPPALEGYADAAAQRQRVIGAVVDGEAAYVVYRTAPRYGPVEPLTGAAISELRRDGGEWGIWTYAHGPGEPWPGHATMLFSFSPGEQGPAAEPIFRWPAEGDPALVASVEESDDGGIRLELTEPAGRSIVLPAEGVEALLDYLSAVHFTRGVQ